KLVFVRAIGGQCVGKVEPCSVIVPQGKEVSGIRDRLVNRVKRPAGRAWRSHFDRRPMSCLPMRGDRSYLIRIDGVRGVLHPVSESAGNGFFNIQESHYIYESLDVEPV